MSIVLNVELAPESAIGVSLADAGLTATLGPYIDLSGGSGGGIDSHYEHSQVTPASTWSVTHNLGKRPSVSVVDSAGDEVEGSVKHLSINALTITFSAAFGGLAFLN